MIVVKLMGGLGNQMFQFALGKHLAVQKNVPLKIDLSFLNNRGAHISYTIRNYELDVFNINDAIATEQELELFTRNHKHRYLHLLSKFFPFVSPYYRVNEKSFRYDPKIDEVHKNSYLSGFWQSSNYFAASESVIRQCFTFKSELAGKNKELAEKIKEGNAVSLHVRRSDYVSNKETNQHHGTCDLSYYQRAVSFMASKIKDPEFFVFSDDAEWVKEHIKPNFPVTYIDHNTGKNSFEDMRLMSLCKHQIIANSSFSWWGAWLNANTEKLIVAPENWFNDSSIDTADLIPVNWLKL